ncbi:MAG: sigma-70 family RNA polymerase sigma factor [Propionibacteriaceae bacterium]|jgi:RNA polymerase sigma factor (sigma-70 family)|nr:sigma-70 family RNA polymerase sigma factor [Propionibacteriaceae bacterium]
MNSEQAQREERLAKRIEAGLIAQELLDQGSWSVKASAEELETLAAEGRQARDDLVLAHLGLVTVIAAESHRRRGVPFADLFQEGCVAIQQAVMSYDWRKGPFGPYAGLWIRSAVRRMAQRPWVPIEQVEVVDLAVGQSYERTVSRTGMAQILQVVPRAEREVLQLRSGWNGKPRTRQAVATELGLTVAKVRHLERSGLATVREQWELAEAA